MACVSSPELDDQVLLAYIDGESELEVQRHVEQCPHCQQRVHQLAALQGRLTARLYRTLCPTPHELGEYHLGILSPAQAKAVARHLDDCPHCTQEVNQLAEYLGQLAPSAEPSLLERVREGVRILVTRLVSGGSGVNLSGQLAMAPAYAGIRGDELEAPFVYQAEDIQVIVEVEEDSGQPDHRTVFGLVIGLDDPGGFEAHLWQGGRCVMTVPVDALGNFGLPGLLVGQYELILAGPDLEIHIEHIQVGRVQAGSQEGEDT